jgi:signal transduction histidine kinase
MAVSLEQRAVQAKPEVSYKRARRTYGIVFRVAFALSTVSFLAATAYTQFRLNGVDDAALAIESVASPSIEGLLETREALNEVGRASAGFVAAVRQGEAADARRLDDTLASLEMHGNAYLALELLPFEGDKWQAVDDGVRAVTRAVRGLVEEAREGNSDLVTQHYLKVVQPAIIELSEAIPPTIGHDASIARDLAHEISLLHDESLRVVILLDALSLILAVLSAVVVYTMFRRHARLEDQHSRMQADRVAELSLFAGRVAHDLKNPLSTIALGLEVLPIAESPAEAAETFAMTRGALRRATQLIDGLLSFARAGSGPARKDLSDVRDVLTELGAEYREIARQARIDFAVECPAQAKVGCSSGVLASMMENLIRNAFKYMGESASRRVVARAQIRGARVCVEVEDSGPGVPEEIRDRLFEPFVRGGAKVGDGVGLGLATVKRLVEAYGGSIGVRSKPGAGSTFWFELPLASGVVAEKGEVAQAASQTMAVFPELVPVGPVRGRT